MADKISKKSKEEAKHQLEAEWKKFENENEKLIVEKENALHEMNIIIQTKDSSFESTHSPSNASSNILFDVPSAVPNVVTLLHRRRRVVIGVAAF